MPAIRVDRLDIRGTEDRNRYDRLFEASPSAFIQQSTLWSEVIGALSEDEPVFLIAFHEQTGDDIAGLPLYRYRGPHGSVLNSVPMAGPMGGIFIKDGVPDELRRAAYEILMKQALVVAEESECLSLTLITNPFRDDREFYERYLDPSYVLENFTQFIPLNDQVHRSHSHRNNLNRAKRAGLVAEVVDDPAEIRRWYQVHVSRHTTIGAEPLSLALFEAVLEQLVPAGRAFFVMVKTASGEIASGALYVHHKEVQDVFMISASNEHLGMSPNFLNTDFSIGYARSLGKSIYNWQSSPGRDSGVYSYKKAWGSEEATYCFMTKLLVEPQVIRDIGAEAIRAGYRGHFVLPFQVFSAGFDTKYHYKSIE